jgi:hypothetical protein
LKKANVLLAELCRSSRRQGGAGPMINNPTGAMVESGRKSRHAMKRTVSTRDFEVLEDREIEQVTGGRTSEARCARQPGPRDFLRRVDGVG